jgi:HSP20 family protein
LSRQGVRSCCGLDLIRWDPFGDIAELRSRIDRMFDDELFAFTGGENGHWTPAVDVTDSADQLTVRADLPGIDPKDVKVTVEGDLLTIEGERKEEKAAAAKREITVATK